MPTEQLADIAQPQRDRLALVELRVRFMGEMRRQDLVTWFGIQSAAASRDLALCKELAPANSDDFKGKSNVQGPSFQPIFDFSPERILSWLTHGFDDGKPLRLKAWVASGSQSRLTHPDLDILASLTCVIHQECPLGIGYHSISSGRTEREIVFSHSSPALHRPWCSRGRQLHPTERAIRTFNGLGLSSGSRFPIPISPSRRSPKWTTACAPRLPGTFCASGVWTARRITVCTDTNSDAG